MNIDDKVDLEKYSKMDLNPFCINDGDIYFYHNDKFIIGVLDQKVNCLVRFSYFSPCYLKIDSFIGYDFAITLFLAVQLLNSGIELEFPGSTQNIEIRELLEYLKSNYSELVGIIYPEDSTKVHSIKKIYFFPEELLHELTRFYPYRTNLFSTMIFGEKDNLPIFCINNKMSSFFSENDYFVIQLTENPFIRDPENCKIPKSELEKIFKWLKLNYDEVLSFWKSQGYDDENNEYENISSTKILEGIKSL